MNSICKNSDPTSLTRFSLSCLSILLLILWLLTPDRLHALEFQCEIPGDVRYLKVHIPGKEKLCEVRVKYESSNQDKLVWHAQNETMFCKNRAYELKEKYENTWNYTCSTWPDRDGIDSLSPSQRAILDKQLKAMIERGQRSDPAYKVTAVKAAASTAEDATPGLLAFQYFMDSEKDVTEIIIDNGESSRLITSLENLSSRINSDAPVTSALINNISDTGTLEVHTTVADGSNQACIGSQVLNVSSSGDVTYKSSHQYICHEALTN